VTGAFFHFPAQAGDPMPFDSDNPFAPIDPAEWARLPVLPRIVVHPKQPLPEGTNDWTEPGTDPDDGGPDDWFVPPPTATPSAGQFAPGAPPNTGFGSPNPAVTPDPFAAYWSQVPASRIGALAWAAPYLPSNTPPPLPVLRTPTLGVDSGPWLSMQSLPGPTIPNGGILAGLLKLGTTSLLPTPLLPADGSLPGPGGPASPPMPGVLQAFRDGLGAGSRQVAQSVQSFSGPAPVPAPVSPAAQPIGWSDLASPSGIAPKLAYQFGQSAPTLAGGVVGRFIGGRIGLLAGPEGGPVGALIGGGFGAAALSAAQTLGPVYAAELQKNPNDPEGAWDRAWKQAEISGVFTGASWAVFPARFFQSPVKQLVFQMFGAQPALAVGQRVASNIVEGRPATEGIGEAYGQGVVGTAVPALGHTMVRPFLPTRAPAANSRRSAEPITPPYREGSFSISDWTGYPDHIPKPTGPFRLLQGEEYQAARKAANRANQRIRRSAPELYRDKEVHEIHTVKFGGSPTDRANKVVLSKEDHRPVTDWWEAQQRKLERGE
jgi:hypothetical protein